MPLQELSQNLTGRRSFWATSATWTTTARQLPHLQARQQHMCICIDSTSGDMPPAKPSATSDCSVEPDRPRGSLVAISTTGTTAPQLPHLQAG